MLQPVLTKECTGFVSTFVRAILLATKIRSCLSQQLLLMQWKAGSVLNGGSVHGTWKKIEDVMERGQRVWQH